MKAHGPLLLLLSLTITVSRTEPPLVAPVQSSSPQPSRSVPFDPPAPVPVPIRDLRSAGEVLLLPSSCLQGDGSFDAVIHFHGAENALRAALIESELNAALLVINGGEISRDYRERWAAEGIFEWLLGRLVKLVERQCPLPNRRVRRLGLSAWSAGFAAVEALLRHPGAFARTDAVLLADGLHAPLLDRAARTLPADALATLGAFAQEAAAGKKLFALTHSEIRTEGYASTTESADHLLARLGLQRIRQPAPGPRPGMVRLSTAVRGALSVEGFAGADERAHGQHLWALGHTLFRRLRQYWAGALLPAARGASAQASSGPPVAVSVEIDREVTCTKTGNYLECSTDL